MSNRLSSQSAAIRPGDNRRPSWRVPGGSTTATPLSASAVAREFGRPEQSGLLLVADGCGQVEAADMRYFFHTYDNGKISPDADGFEFPDDPAARYEASRFLSEMSSELIPAGGGRKYEVEVIDENGRAITKVGFEIQVT